MKFINKDSDKVPIMVPGPNNRPIMPRFMSYLILFVSVTYVIYTLKLLSSPSLRCDDDPLFRTHVSLLESPPNTTARDPQPPPLQPHHRPTTSASDQQLKLNHIVFGIAGSAKLWDKRKNYIKLWWKPNQMRGVVWVDSRVQTRSEENLPSVRVSEDTTRFAYSNRQGHRSAIRISRIVSETFRTVVGRRKNEGEEEIRWFVMGDDDTVFVTENLVRVLAKYDYREYYYVGGLSESHMQNIYFSYSMAFGGGGFAISYPLAKAVERMQDRCIQRYPGLFASDDRMQACMAELGVPLTRELGFHQVGLFFVFQLVSVKVVFG